MRWKRKPEQHHGDRRPVTQRSLGRGYGWSTPGGLEQLGGDEPEEHQGIADDELLRRR